MYAATVSQVLSLIGYPSNDGNTATAKVAIGTATKRFEAYTETRLALSSTLDYFSVPKYFEGILKLSTGFVTEDGVRVMYNANGAPITRASPGEALAADDMIVDLEKGLIHVDLALNTGFRNVVVSYESGFSSGEDSVYQEIPEGVSSAVALHAASLLVNQPGAISKEKVNLMLPAIKGYSAQAIGLMNAFLRPRAMCLDPYSSTVEAL